MKKIVRQQNYLKELIEAQGNNYLSKQALKCLIRSTIEPLLDAPESSAVLYRISDKSELQGALKRLEYSQTEVVCYDDESNNLKELVWANTEFICVMTHRFVAIIIWDNNTGDENLVRYYSLYNSKLQNEPLDIIKRNSVVDISTFQEKFTPDRRDNILLNASIRRLLSNLEETASDAVLNYAEQSAEKLSGVDYAHKNSRVIAHEIRNQLSICDLYTEIIKKQLEINSIKNDDINRAISIISKSIKMANNSLISLKNERKTKLEETDLNEAINSAIELASVYLEEKDIKLEVESTDGINCLTDSEKLIAVIINLIKNAVEAFPNIETDEKVQNGKYIKIKTEKEEENAVIFISNNAPGIKTPEKIFDYGFSTKNNTKNSGLGLWICRQSIEDQNGTLVLERSSEDYTEFAIRLTLN